MKTVRLPFYGIFLLCAVTAVGQTKRQSEEVVARHLDSIGTAQARAAVKSRTAGGAGQSEVVVGSNLRANGTALVVSIGRQYSIQMKFPGGSFPDEQFVFDGKDAQIALMAPGKRTPLGEFFYRHNELLREGLFGGTLLTSWPLFDVPGRQARLKYEGLKKIDGRQLHDVVYLPKKKTDDDLVIHLYFEPDNFRHVKTVYSFTADRSLALDTARSRRTRDKQTAHNADTHYRVEETFSEFRAVDGITLPALWKVQYTSESDQTYSLAWHFSLDKFAHNNVTE